MNVTSVNDLFCINKEWYESMDNFACVSITSVQNWEDKIET